MFYLSFCTLSFLLANLQHSFNNKCNGKVHDCIKAHYKLNSLICLIEVLPLPLPSPRRNVTSTKDNLVISPQKVYTTVGQVRLTFEKVQCRQVDVNAGMQPRYHSIKDSLLKAHCCQYKQIVSTQGTLALSYFVKGKGTNFEITCFGIRCMRSC